MSDAEKEAPKEFCDVVRDDGQKIQALVTVLQAYARDYYDEWDPIMVMLEEINTRLGRLGSLACEEGDDRQADRIRQQEAA